MKIAPSILDADLNNLQNEVNSISQADRIHLDVMDRRYVPKTIFLDNLLDNINFPIKTEAHLMTENPAQYFAKFLELGVSGITFQIETVRDENEACELLQELKAKNIKAGLCLDAWTSADVITDKVLNLCDQLLIMSVKAGKGGQSFLPESLGRVKYFRDLGFSNEIEIDGGVKRENFREIFASGVDVAVMGSAIMNLPAQDRNTYIEQLQK